MDIKSMPKETLAQLLFFLAENEDFNAVSEQLAEGVAVNEVRTVLRELAEGLLKEVYAEVDHQYDPQKDRHLSDEAKTIIGYLSPGEEKALLTAFGFVESPRSILKQ